jgi:hypothetical protein
MRGRDRPASLTERKQNQRPKSAGRRVGLIAGATGMLFAGLLSAGHIFGGIAGIYEIIRDYEKFQDSSDREILNLANEMSSEFAKSLEILQKAGFADFSRVQLAADNLKKIQYRNGHLWYFSGEIKRMSLHARFTAKGCLRDFGAVPSDYIDSYHEDFRRYLEIEHSLPESQTKGGNDVAVCFNRANGFCVQRTAWINHLLANDFYQQALVTGDPFERSAKFKRAKELVDQALTYRRIGGGVGFMECIDSVSLEHHIKEALKKEPGP